MGQLGLGVMIDMLGGYGNTGKVFSEALNKEIKSIELDDNRLKIKFVDDTGIQLWDNGQSCCESRYMNIDDKLEDFFGAILLSGEIQPADDQKDEYGEEHEVEFLVLKTSKGDLVVSNHNEHNGYYGGFSINVAEL